jgi:hypothetical protein
MATAVYTGAMMLAWLLACAPKEAPTAVDGSLHWFFANFESATDEEMREAVLDLDMAEGRGIVDDLTADEQATVELDPPRDIGAVTGLFLAGPVACSIEDNETVHLLLDQDGVYTEATGSSSYDAYSRVYTSDADAYFAREENILWWETTYTVTVPIVGTTYTAVIEAGIRYVPEADGVGPIVIERDHLPAPGTMEAENNDFFDQDYQIDVILPDGLGASKHAYAVWRDAVLGGLADEEDFTQTVMLDGLEDYDRDTEKVCELGNF